MQIFAPTLEAVVHRLKRSQAVRLRLVAGLKAETPASEEAVR